MAAEKGEILLLSIKCTLKFLLPKIVPATEALRMRRPDMVLDVCIEY
jgi:hypothetical protein